MPGTSVGVYCICRLQRKYCVKQHLQVKLSHCDRCNQICLSMGCGSYQAHVPHMSIVAHAFLQMLLCRLAACMRWHGWVVDFLPCCTALLQEMQKDWCNAPGCTMIPAYWGQSLQTLHGIDLATQSAQVHNICAMLLRLSYDLHEKCFSSLLGPLRY